MGRLLFEVRVPTPSGASLALERRPARHVAVRAYDGAGAVVGEGETDEQGAFVLAPSAPAAVLAAEAAVAHEGHALAVASDPMGSRTHEVRVALPEGHGELLVIAAEDDPRGPAGAFHVLDTLLRGVQAVRAWTGETLPPLFAYWGRGTTTSWSYYRAERPEGSGRFCIELLGGEPGRQQSTDTDEHDEAIILHELGHFVFDRLSTDSSPGGNHPAGYLLDPGLAWEEARATFFATAVLGAPHYRDTIGLEPHGRLRVDHDLERRQPGPSGIGSELAVSEILWDLADGADGLPDVDADPVALGPAAILRAMMALRERPGAFPSIASFLSLLVERGLASRSALKALLVAGQHPEAMLPATGDGGWPIDLALPATTAGKIDGWTNPAPSGGPARPENGFDAVRVYRLHVPVRSWLTARLHIAGSGLARDRTDLDLELRTLRAEIVASARGEAPLEVISQRVEPGWYVVYVRDGGSGNRAGYVLEATATPAP